MSNRIIGCSRFVLCALVVLAYLPLCGVAEASSVVPMTLERMADHAGQVVMAEVASVRSYWAENPRRIESEITFRNTNYLKGRLRDSSDSFRLIVPGGKVGEMQMRVCCAPTFATGERWVLFVLPTYKTFPVVGLHQGAFRIISDTSGVDRVLGASRSPVLGLDEQGFINLASRHVCQASERLISANGVRVKDRPSEAKPNEPANGSAREQAMTCEDFLARIRPVLENSQSHGLTEPAGRRILIDYRSVPLRLAKRQHSTKPAASGKRASGVRDGGGRLREGEGVSRSEGGQVSAPAGNHTTKEVTR